MSQKIELQLKTLREKKKITQSELGKALGFSFQTISKWENGVTMPDITYLPPLAKYFNVELEVLLGMKPLEQEPPLQKYSEEEYWRDRLECTKNWKMLFYNEDYLEFLVTKVWRIRKPIHILDCACGYGYLEEGCFIGSDGRSVREKLPDMRKVWEYSFEKKELDYQMGTIAFLAASLSIKVPV